MTVNLLDVLAFLRTHSRRLLVWSVAFAALGLLAAFLVPKTFRAAATILPPEEDDAAVSLQQVRRGLGSMGGIGRLGSYFTQADVALAVLKSQTVYETVIHRFDLQKVYGKSNVDDAVRELRGHTTVKIGSEGTITVTVEDGSARRCADLANSFLDLLDNFNQEVRSFRARRSRQFLVRRVAQEDSLLNVSEALLAAYQRKHGAVVVSPEDRSAMSAAGTLMSRKVQTEIDLQLAREYASPNSEEVQRLSAEERELSRQAGEIPATQIGGAGLVRSVAIEEQILAMLALQLEDARIREVMDTPTIQVLDRATPPVHPIWPRKSVLTLFGGILGFALGLVEVRGRFPGGFRRSP